MLLNQTASNTFYFVYFEYIVKKEGLEWKKNLYYKMAKWK